MVKAFRASNGRCKPTPKNKEEKVMGTYPTGEVVAEYEHFILVKFYSKGGDYLESFTPQQARECLY